MENYSPHLQTTNSKNTIRSDTLNDHNTTLVSRLVKKENAPLNDTEILASLQEDASAATDYVPESS